jgi:tagatose 1,6-diphosphate aldolase/sulfofructosephosphate aldolase
VTEPGPGTLRGLRCLTTADGRAAAVAVDQRQALRAMLAAAGAPAHPEALRAFKVAVARALGDVAPALLVDPQYGLPAVAAAADVSARLPLMVALEESGTLPWRGGQRSFALGGWSARQARAAGACAGKLLVYARVDHLASLEHATALIESTRRDCRAADLPFVLEILPFRRDEEAEDEYRAAYGRHVLALAELGASWHPDLLKLAWPGPLGADEPEPGGLQVLGDLDVSWALLSAGAEFERFEARVLRALDEGGACGFIAGRALWQDAVGAADVDAVLRDGARRRLERLLGAIAGRGRALALPPLPGGEGWFRA